MWCIGNGMHARELRWDGPRCRNEAGCERLASRASDDRVGRHPSVETRTGSRPLTRGEAEAPSRARVTLVRRPKRRPKRQSEQRGSRRLLDCPRQKRWGWPRLGANRPACRASVRWLGRLDLPTPDVCTGVGLGCVGRCLRRRRSGCPRLRFRVRRGGRPACRGRRRAALDVEAVVSRAVCGVAL
jgi:hypothetical protein